MSKSRVMIVEDEASQALVLERQLVSLGHSVAGTARSGEEALEMAVQCRPDLVLMDIVLGGELDGIDAADQIRRTFDIPVIFLTANSDEATIARAKCVDPAGYLIKPTKKGELSTAIELGLYRHTIEQRLRQSEEKYKTLFESASDAVLILEGTTIIECNQRALTMFGHPREELLGRSPFDFSPPFQQDGHPSIQSSVARINSALLGNTEVFEWILCRPDATPFATEVTLIRLQIKDQPHLQAVIRDIDFRKRAEEALERERILLRTLIDRLPDAIYVKDRQGRKTVANLADVHNMGLRSESEVLGKNDFDLFPRELAEAFYADDKAVIRTGNAIVNREEYVLDENGEKRWLLTTKVPLRDKEGRITGLVGIGHDITSRRHTEESLRLFRTLLDHSSDAIEVMSSDTGRILDANEKAWRDLGYTRDELLSLTVFDIDPNLDASTFKNRGEETQQSRSMVFETQHRRKDGSSFPVEVSLNHVQLDKGYFVASARDVTDRIRQEEERTSLQIQLRQRNLELEKTLEEMKKMQDGLVQSEKMASIGQLTAGIAHEINNPLAFVSSNLNRFREYFDEVLAVVRGWDPIREELNRDPHYQARASEMREAEEQADLKFVVEDFKTLMKHTVDGTERIKSIVERLRGFTHLADSGFGDADINAAVEDSLNLTWNELKYKATIQKEYGQLPMVECNIGEIKQVLVNLLVNAAHAIPDKGTITIRTLRIESRVLVEVEDTGSGISAANVKRIFDPFFTTKPVGKGTGLGLWISATIIQKHRGSLTAESEQGRGTTMRIELPVQQRQIEGATE